MPQTDSVKTASHERFGYSLSIVEEALMQILVMAAPLTVEELVDHLPQFRWVEVLRVLSQLWGQGRIELEDHEGVLKVWMISAHETRKSPLFGMPKESQSNGCNMDVTWMLHGGNTNSL